MQGLHDQFADDSDVTVLAVHLDDRGDPLGYLQKNEYTFRSVPDADGIAAHFDVTRIPTFVVIAADGTLLHRRVGALDDAARDEIARIAVEASR